MVTSLIKRADPRRETAPRDRCAFAAAARRRSANRSSEGRHGRTRPLGEVARAWSPALAEDLGSGDVTAEATVPGRGAGPRPDRAEAARGGLRPRGGRGGDAPVRGRAIEKLAARAVARRTVPAEVAVAERPGARRCLAAERTALNFLGHLSGIATLTARYVEAVAGTGAADPRHPQDDPGPARAGEGGGRGGRRAQPPDGPLRRDPDQGEPHRPGRRPGRGPSTRPAPRVPTCAIEVECRNLDEVAYALGTGADLLLLDNMDPATLREAVELRDSSRRRDGALAGGLRRGQPRDGPRRSPRPVSTSSRSAPSPTPPRRLDFSLLIEPA